MKDLASTDPLQTSSDIQLGATIANRYTITAKLGAGGFAVVYRAFDREIERDVAIKILKVDILSSSESSQQTMLERFRREARLAARIRHPNVVEIYDLGELQDLAHPYIIMEILEGHDLSIALNKDKGMPPTRAIPLFTGALEALAEAHRLGIIHKDIKPANLFLNRPNTRQESLKIVDFGIAHMGGSLDSRLTQTGMIFGTPQYLPPEYIQAQIVTPAMDVYQMALVLVEMLTGRTVVNEESPWQCAMQHVMRTFSLPASLLTGPLGPVLTRALEANHETRYPDAEAFAEALRQIDPATVADVRGSNLPHTTLDTVTNERPPRDSDSPAMIPTLPELTVQPSANTHPAFDHANTERTSALSEQRRPLLIAAFVGLLASLVTFTVVVVLLQDKTDTSLAVDTTPAPEFTAPTTTTAFHADAPPETLPTSVPSPESEPASEPEPHASAQEDKAAPAPSPDPRPATRANHPGSPPKKQPAQKEAAPQQPEKPRRPTMMLAP